VAQNVIDWVWKHSRAVNGSLIVLLAIAHEANRDGITEMSALELSRKTRLSERSVRTAVRDLVKLRELEVPSAGGGRGRPSGYRVPLKGAESAPFEPGNPAESAPFSGNPAESAPFEPAGNPAESAPFESRNGSSERASPGNPAESAPFETSDVFITSTGIDEVQVKDVPAITSRPDVERLCRHLADRIEANGCKRPAIGRKWRDAARLMIDRDGRTEQQVMTAIDWCQDNEFWRSNILSMPKLREKYDQLRMQAGRAKRNGRTSTTDDRVRAGLDLAEKYARQEQQERRRELPS
jgi:hypothetical protein